MARRLSLPATNEMACKRFLLNSLVTTKMTTFSRPDMGLFHSAALYASARCGAALPTQRCLAPSSPVSAAGLAAYLRNS